MKPPRATVRPQYPTRSIRYSAVISKNFKQLAIKPDQYNEEKGVKNLMGIMRNILTFALCIITTILLVSCVGTIKETKSRTSNSVPASTTASFGGVESGSAISHDKVWVRFKPATGGSAQFDYHAFVNSSNDEVASLNGAAGNTDDEGYLYLTIENLKYYTLYNINVRVFDRIQKRYDSNVKSIDVWTSSSFVPGFDGVTAVDNVIGSNGTTRLKVIWTQAQTPEITSGDPFSPDHTVSGYNIYYSTSLSELWGMLGEADQNSINIINYPSSKIKSLTDPSLTEYEIGQDAGDELTSGRTYYVAIRARQSSAIPKYELNINVVSKATLSEQALAFNGLTSITIPNSDLGFSQFNLSWGSCDGCDRYRVYIVPTAVDVGSVHPVTHDAYKVSADITNLTLTSGTYTASHVAANSSYKIYMVACRDSTCGWDGATLSEDDIKGRFSSQSATSIPNISTFSSDPGTPVQAGGELGLTTLDISFTLDTTTGYYTRLKVFRIIDKNANITTDPLANANLVELAWANAGAPYIHSNTGSLESSASPAMVEITGLIPIRFNSLVTVGPFPKS